MNPGLIALAFALASLAIMGATIAPTLWPGVYRAEPRRTIERLYRAIIWPSPSDSNLGDALRLIELAASSGQDVSRAASVARTLLERRIAQVEGWGDRLGRFTGEEGDPAPLAYMSDLPTGTAPPDRVARAKAWLSAHPQSFAAATALGSARVAVKAGLDPSPALAEARAILARHALSLQSALDELRAIR